METLSSTTDDRTEALQGIAEAMNAHIQNQDNIEPKQSLEVQFSPEKSLTGLMYRVARDYRFVHKKSDDSYEPSYFVSVNDSEKDIVDFWETICILSNQAAHQSKWGDELFTDVGEFSTEYNHIDREYASLSHARKVYAKSDYGKERLHSVLIPARIAASHKPENWNPQVKPKNHKHESAEDKLFRIAWHDLNKIARINQEFTHNETLYVKVLDKYTAGIINDGDLNTILSDPKNQDIRDGYLAMNTRAAAFDLINAIKDPGFTSKAYNQECYRLNHLYHLRHDAPKLKIEETDWTILPPGTLDELNEGDGSGNETRHFADPERMKWLAHLAISWSKDAYVAVANLDKSGNYDYRVAVLPQQKNGALIEHAVAENPSSGNAIYVFRGERGLEDNGTSWLTWKEVLSDSKSGARALGARRILHGAFVDENVTEYLTRPDSELDKPHYKR